MGKILKRTRTGLSHLAEGFITLSAGFSFDPTSYTGISTEKRDFPKTAHEAFLQDAKKIRMDFDNAVSKTAK